MADAALQDLLDVGSTGHGIRIQKRVDAVLKSSYYLQGNVRGVGKAMWVDVTTADSDADKSTAILAAFGVA